MSTKGKKFSAESRKLMSEKRKEFWASEKGEALRKELSKKRKGKRLPEKALRKAAEWHTGRPLTDETREKISVALSGRTLSEKHRRRIGDANRGTSRGKGQPKSEAHKRKIGAKSKGNKVWLGRKHSEESKHKISKGLAKAYREGRHDVHNPVYESGQHQSNKAGTVHYRSSLELAFYRRLDANDDVVKYVVEPDAIGYKINGKCRNYVPDLYVEYACGLCCIVEIKPECFLDDVVVQAKISAAKKIYGDSFEVWTENDLQFT